MSFLDGLIKDPKYQQTDPRKPEEVSDPNTIISPDTRRENRIPPGQTRTKKWPVLDAHGAPPVDLATWQFEVDGLVEKPLKFSLDEFMQLAVVKVYSDFHCVTRWSRLDNVWTGVPTLEIAKLAGLNRKRSSFWLWRTTMAGPRTCPSNTFSKKIRSLLSCMTARRYHPSMAARFV